MVRLGFLRDAVQCPPVYPRVYLKPGRATDTDVYSTVYSEPNQDGVQVYELELIVPVGVDNLAQWVKPMASIISGIGWQGWCIDAHSVSQVLNLYLAEALKQWGAIFWDIYREESVVLLQVGLQRDAAALSVAAWEEQFSHVRFDPVFDLDAMEEELLARRKTRAQKIKSLLWPRFLASRPRAT